MAERTRVVAELSRRRFLQAALATGSVAALDLRWMREALAGPPLGRDDRILVIVELNGGNDGLNTLVPFETAAYYDLRRATGIAIDPASVLPVGGGAGLHPSLAFVKSMYDSGRVAIVRGVGHPDNDLSHFSCMAKLMSGMPTGGPATTGWIGRYLDAFGSDPVRAVSIGDGTLPLLLVGARTRAAGLPALASGLFGSDRTNEWDAIAFDTVASFAPGSGMPWTDLAAASGRDAIATAAVLQPAYELAPSDQRPLVRDLTIGARLINLDLGVRVVHVRLTGFDAHSAQRGPHDALLAHVDAAIKAFFTTLDPRFADRLVLATLSEFGRRVKPNGSNGTDHGTASVAFIIGDRVRGGLTGVQSSLTSLDPRGDLHVEVDSRALFATLLARWLGADDRDILGASYPLLDLFATPAPSSAPAALADPRAAYVAVSPSRLLDTRTGNGAANRPLAGGAKLDLVIFGRGGVPLDSVSAVVLNVTVTRPSAAGYLTVFPAGSPQPTVSNLNFTPGQTVANLVIVKVGANGRVTLSNSNGATDVLVDLVGWFPVANKYVPLEPRRLLDTRVGVGAPQGRVGPGSTTRLGIRGGPVPAQGVDAVVMNVTAVDADATSYVTVWPSGADRPNASNLNTVAGATVPNLVISPVGTDGTVSIYNASGSVHLLADIVGWFPPNTGFDSLTPVRLLDTRALMSAGRVGPGRTVTFDGSGNGLVPANAHALALNVTAVNPSTAGYVTVFPNGTMRPEASHLNFVAGDVVANLVLTALGTNGKIDIFNAAGSVDVLVDVVGWFE